MPDYTNRHTGVKLEQNQKWTDQVAGNSVLVKVQKASGEYAEDTCALLRGEMETKLKKLFQEAWLEKEVR